MSRIKKYLLMIISLIIATCICIPSFSKAATVEQIKTGPNEGNSVYLSYYSLEARDDLYCIQHGAPLSGSTRYTVQKYVKIVGNKATDTKGNETVSTANGIMAYIIGKGQGYGSVGNYTAGQRAMYYQINKWFSASGSALEINLSDRRNDVYSPNYLITEGTQYAQSIGNATTDNEVKNNTKKENIKVTQYEGEDKTSYIRIGPFQYTFPGQIDEITVKDQSKANVEGVRYSVFEGNNEKFINANEIKSGQNFYISIKADGKVAKITGITGKVTSQNQVLSAEMWFLISGYKQNLLLVNPGSSNVPNTFDINDEYDIPLLGKIGIVKVDEDNKERALPDVEFIIQYQKTGEYIKSVGEMVEYTSKKEEAKTFKSGKDGKILVENVLLGKYAFYETKNPHEGFEVKTTPAEVETTETANYVIVTNKQKYIKLSGYVWEDLQSGKMSVRNNLYKDNENDNNDIRVKNIKVMLKDKEENVVKETVTDDNGEYIFKDVLIDELENYHIEFVYDGLIYENVTINLDKENGSKAAEGSLRAQFNNQFARVDAYSKDTVSVKDGTGAEQYKVQYKLNLEEHKAEILKEECSIIADTQSAGYTITVQRGQGIAEIKNINLGIYKRTQADLALMQDVDQVRVGVKGYEHIYKYGSRLDNKYEAVEDAWNVGIKFRNPYGSQSYLRPVYKADAEYLDTENSSNNLRMLLTYKIGLRNEEDITAKINSVVDYYDERYTVVGIGVGVDGKGNITATLKNTETTTSKEGYKAVVIDTSPIIIPARTTKYIYIQFELSRENVLELLNEAEELNNEITPNLKNVAEITSYTSYSDENATQLYAAVDKDSVLGNTEPGDKTTYEDDTDESPNVGITIANPRAISGMVFEDNADTKLLEKQNIRQGNGKYDEKESKVAGVTVQMLEVDNNGNITVKHEAKTANDGTYIFSGFTPGNYIIRYTWGDGIYKVVGNDTVKYENVVENYKSTVFEEDRYKQETSNKRYYQTNTEIAQTHAIDDWATRQKIDTELNSHGEGENNGYNYSTTVTTRQMISDAPQMEFGIEYTDTDLENVTLINGQVKFEVKNMDFGIIERAKQGIMLRKRVAHLTIKLADGQTIVDADVDENGKLSGQTNYLTYMQPSANNGTYNRGFLKAELDAELMQTAYVEIKYEFEVINTSESDFASEGYYKFGNAYYTSRGKTGELQKEKDVVTMSPSKIVDYLDAQTIFKVGDETNTKYGWKPVTVEELKASGLVATNVTDGAEWNSKANAYVTDYLKDAKMKPVMVISEEKRAADIEKLYLVAEKTLAPNEESNYTNQAEIIEINKTSGGKLTSTPGNYKPFEAVYESDDSTAEKVIIMPSTGGNRNYVVITIVSITALAILGAGVFFIRKKF